MGADWTTQRPVAHACRRPAATSWVGTWLEVAAGRLQAWATGRWVVQSAPTGYGAIIDPEGHVVGRTTLGRPETLHGRPELRTGATPYVIVGDAPTVGAAAALLGLAWALTRRQDRRP